ncbi:hypothetical protein MTR67_040764 [Solanum verrucosum]|uniref:Uncharacterized protein n=1 Tax=Solanum verrucosum TaxID=315347 RepID=A0AAF0UK65_SOLVR|nr:hypothetical protein MTR67_040764 [Solanum verrucosum]
MLEIVVVIDDVSTDCTSDGTENNSESSNDNYDYNSEELKVLAQERRRHYAGVRVKTLKGEHKCDDPCGKYKCLVKSSGKIETEQVMEPPELVNLVGKPRMNKKRDKYEALKRQTEWVAPRRGRKMTYLNCGIPGHNARGCHKNSEEGISNTGQVKSKKQKKTAPKGPTWKGNTSKPGNMLEKLRKEKEKKQVKENITLIDEKDVEDFPLTSPQPTQDCASDEDEDFGLDVEDDMP